MTVTEPSQASCAAPPHRRIGRSTPPVHRRHRKGRPVVGWACLAAGVLTYPVPLIPSTTMVLAGLFLLAPSQPWARAAVVRLRRRLRSYRRRAIRHRPRAKLAIRS